MAFSYDSSSRIPRWYQALQYRRNEIAEELAGIDNNSTRENPGSKPNASGDGSIDHDGYRMNLVAELEKYNQMLKDGAAIVEAELALANDEDAAFEIEIAME